MKKSGGPRGRKGPEFWGGALLAVAGGLVACNQIFSIVPGTESGSGGHGGAGATTATATTATAASTGATGGNGAATSAASTTAVTSTSGTGGSTTSTTTTTTTGTGGAPADGGVSLADCVLLLHMDEPSWSGAAGEVKDSSGKGNNGTAQGTANTAAGGKFGRAASLDGNGWVDVPNSTSLQPTTAVTYAAWIKPSGLTEPPDPSQNALSPGIIAKRQSFGEEVAFTLFLWSGNTAFVDIQGTTEGLYRFNSTTVFTNGTWYHLAVVYDGTIPSVILYVDGQPELPAPGMTLDTSIAESTADLLVGNLPGGGTTYAGLIDEVVVWNRALSAGEILSLYNATTEL
jgi:hypothetical protein